MLAKRLVICLIGPQKSDYENMKGWHCFENDQSAILACGNVLSYYFREGILSVHYFFFVLISLMYVLVD